MSKKNSLIWKFEAEGSAHSSYLIGTMHVKDAKAFGRMDDMKDCINACEVFATEFNLEEADQEVAAQHMSLPEGETLNGILGEKKFQKLRKIINKAFALDLTFFNGQIPIMITNVITGKILSEDMQLSLDESLWTYARESEKVMMGIETFGEQMEILDGIPMEYQLKQLKELAKNTKKFRNQIISTATLFADENIEQLYKSVKKSTGKLRKIMLYDRNAKMAERVSKIAEEKSICFAVGAGHLLGKKGLVKLLKDEGYKVKPVFKSNHQTDGGL